MVRKKRNNGIYAQAKFHPIKEVITRNQLIVLSKLSNGRKRKIIYLGGVDMSFLFIEKNGLASGNTKRTYERNRK